MLKAQTNRVPEVVTVLPASRVGAPLQSRLCLQKFAKAFYEGKLGVALESLQGLRDLT